MKRERIKIETEITSDLRHSFRSPIMRFIPPAEMEMRREALAEMKRAKRRGVKLTFKQAMQQIERRLDYKKKNEARPADSYVVRLMEQMQQAVQVQINAKKFREECNQRLLRYLATGERHDGKKPRVRIIEEFEDAGPTRSAPATGDRGPFEGA
jgi:hypothetical protein